jgi:hypothetical protein
MKGQYHLNVLGPNYTPNVVRNWRKYKGFGQKITYCGQFRRELLRFSFLSSSASLETYARPALTRKPGAGRSSTTSRRKR